MGIMMIIVVAGDMFLPPPGIPLFSIIYFGLKWIKWVIEIDFWTIALIVVGLLSIPYMLAVKLPMLSGKMMLSILKRAEHAGINMVKSPKTYVPIMLFIFAFLSWVSSATLSDFSSLGRLIRNMIISLLVVFIISFFTSSGGHKEQSSNNNRRGQQQGQQGVYNDIKSNTRQETSMNIIPEPLLSTASKFINTVTMSSSAGQEAGSGVEKAIEMQEGTEMAKESMQNLKGKYGIGGPKILAFLILGGIIMIVQWVLLVGVAWSYVSFILPAASSLLYGPIMSILGVGTDFGFVADQTILDGIAPQIDLEEEKLMFQQMGARASCVMSVNAASCMSEWRMNNTVQPGSEEVGQEYQLETEQFIVEGGRTVDVSGRRADLPLTIRMALSNPRYGLKGVTAEDVSYKVGITGSDKQGYYCNTGNHELYDHVDRGRDTSNLAPGDRYQLTSVQRSKDFYQNNITLASCGLLQPGQIEQTRQAELEVNYTYTSQATQQFQAMSEENRLENDVTQTYKKSETADTPVKSFVTVTDPVTFRDSEEGETFSNVIDVEIGFETDDPDIEYQINTEDVEFRPSRLTAPTGSDPSPSEIVSPNEIDSVDDQCDFELTEESRNGDEYLMELGSQAKRSIEAQQRNGRFWDARSSPPTFSCSFELINPSSISATGETLIKDVEGSYNVTTSFLSQNFKVWNTQCTGRECPILVPEDQKQEVIENTEREQMVSGLYSNCDRSVAADASGGCTVRPIPTNASGAFDTSGWRVISQKYSDGKELSTGDTIEANIIDTGETAWTYGGLKEEIQSKANSLNSFDICDESCLEDAIDLDREEKGVPKDWQAIGIEEGKLEEAKNGLENGRGVVISEDNGYFSLRTINTQYCSEFSGLDEGDYEGNKSAFSEALADQSYDPVYVVVKDKGDCSDQYREWLTNEYPGFSEGNTGGNLMQCHPVYMYYEGQYETANAFANVLSGGIFGDDSDVDISCAQNFRDEISRSSSSFSDFDVEDSVWIYNDEENYLDTWTK